MSGMRRLQAAVAVLALACAALPALAHAADTTAAGAHGAVGAEGGRDRSGRRPGDRQGRNRGRERRGAGRLPRRRRSAVGGPPACAFGRHPPGRVLRRPGRGRVPGGRPPPAVRAGRRVAHSKSPPDGLRRQRANVFDEGAVRGRLPERGAGAGRGRYDGADPALARDLARVAGHLGGCCRADRGGDDHRRPERGRCVRR